MSAEAMAWAKAQDTGGCGQKLLLLVLADTAGASGVCFPGRERIAEWCECRPETVSVNMTKLVELGLVAKVERRRANGSRTSDWVVLAPRTTSRGSMRDAEVEEYPAAVADLARKSSCEDSSHEENHGGQVRKTGGPEPTEEPPVSLLGAGARDEPRRKPVSYRGRKVPREQIAMAERLLVAMEAHTHRGYAPYTKAGDPTDSLRQVIGAIRLREDVSENRWIGAIANTVENPPDWVDGSVKLGHIFGGRAVEWALDNKGSMTGGNNGESGYTRKARQREEQGWGDDVVPPTVEEKQAAIARARAEIAAERASS